ncbi:electron transport complex subunit RsxC [Colwellia asteriadis]|uniref:Ion-translocating oxidoreductase complex subunit C n=1 Tax=Colwellia asteriadis TaxID=517723 RepID=A0ABN1L8M0_9GAMM
MQSILERITSGKFWSFHGGIHPPEQKALTATKAIRTLPLPKQLIVPLQQHIGGEGDLLVNVGDKVLKGQPLTLASNPMALPIHAPTSGIITAIKKSVIAHPSGLSELCLFIDVDGKDTWIKRNKNQDYQQLSSSEIIKKIADAGISGMGGAGFPTHIKTNSAANIDFLIINGAECEPYITADDLLMTEQSQAIVDGINILKQVIAPKNILIAIEDNKPNAIKAMEIATKGLAHIHVCVVPTKYPTGGEKQLIKVLTGKEVPSGSLPINCGIIMQNVATCFAISQAVINDTPLIERVVTVTGQALDTPQNAWVLLGTTIDFLLSQFSAQPLESGKQPVIMGGPMMGFGVLSEQVPIIKTSNCILIPSKQEMPSAFDRQSKEVECIRCGECAVVCPSQLLPQELQWSAKAKDYPQLEKLNLRDCIDCGACAYVCPSQIPLVQYYRIAKAEIRQQQILDIKAEKAKVRFEARKLRLEKEKIAREEKQKKAAAARKAAMNKATPEAANAKSAVAAALARVKAKKAGTTTAAAPESNKSENNVEDNTQKSQVAAAIARAKAKREQKNQTNDRGNNANTTEDKPPQDSAIESTADNTKSVASKPDDKKAKIAAAIAKAKAKKEAKSAPSITQSTDEASTEAPIPATQSDNSQADDKKAKIAAAIAKAKAKKLAKSTQANQSTDLEVTSGNADVDANNTTLTKSEKKAAIKPSHEPNISDNIGSSNTDPSNTDSSNKTQNQADDKKAKIAAAIAKAKAKKLAKSANENTSNNANNNTQKELT